MRRIMVIASLIGLFMVTGLDLEARHRRKGLPQIVRAGIAVGLLSQITFHHHRSSYAYYNHREGRQIIKEIRRNEKRIWKLEKKIHKFERRRSNYREIRRLEQEVNWLERRNDYLRNLLSKSWSRR